MRLMLKLNDVAACLRRVLRRSGASLTAMVKHFLRLGLMVSGKPLAKPFVVDPRPLGLPLGLSYDHVADLIEALDSPLHR
jgi:hypothetical protein